MYRTTWERFFSAASNVAFGFALGAGIVFLNNVASKQAIRDECETKLLYQQTQYRAMLKDTHRFYTVKMDNAATAEVICLDIENMTARELLWHMEDIFGDSAVEVH